MCSTIKTQQCHLKKNNLISYILCSLSLSYLAATRTDLTRLQYKTLHTMNVTILPQDNNNIIIVLVCIQISCIVVLATMESLQS